MQKRLWNEVSVGQTVFTRSCCVFLLIHPSRFGSAVPPLITMTQLKTSGRCEGSSEAQSAQSRAGELTLKEISMGDKKSQHRVSVRSTIGHHEPAEQLQ